MQKQVLPISISTLLTLQDQKIIPNGKDIKRLKTQQMKLQSIFTILSCHSAAQKHLLMNTNNVIYYGTLTDKGIPSHKNNQFISIDSLDKLRKLTKDDFINEGIFIFQDGSYYFGEIQQGKPSGIGFISNISQSYSYLGTFMKGLPDGLGIEVIGQNVYEGDFVQGKKDGNGVIFYSASKYYEGQFFENNVTGQGKYTLNNMSWEGYWQNGYLQGIGLQKIKGNRQQKDSNSSASSESQYYGNFKRGQKQGSGKYKWGKDYEYYGSFQKGQLNGSGKLKFKSQIYKGKWKDGFQLIIYQQGKNSSRISLRSINRPPYSSRLTNNLI